MFGNSKIVYRIFIIVTFILVILILTTCITMYFWFTSEERNRPPCDYSEPLANPEFLPDGSVVSDGDTYPPRKYFSDNNTIRGCVCMIKPCIRKCCNKTERYVKPYKKRAFCDTNPLFDPFENSTIQVYNSSWQMSEVSLNHFRVLFGDVCRNGKYVLYPEEKHLLMDDGRMFVEPSAQLYHDTSQYCLESMNGSEHVIRTFICFPQGKPEEEKVMFIIYPIGMMISVPFMILTIVVYGAVSELRNLHGKSLMSQTASLCITYISLFVIQVGTNQLSASWCVFLAFVVEFTFLATFFWMNVMCFDIWWVFSGLRAPGGSAKEREHKKFVMYSVYAWGVPALILAISLIMDFVPFIPDSFIKPGFGDVKCWFKDATGTLVYLYLPIAIIVLLNIAMFVSTACKLQSHSKETKVLHGTESRRSTKSNKAERDRFDLYLKLFVVMGINWVLEIVSFFVGGPKSLWFVTDIGNTLQGVLIFLIFVCKRRVLRLVRQKLCPRWISSAPSQSSSSNTNSTRLSKTTSNYSTKTAT